VNSQENEKREDEYFQKMYQQWKGFQGTTCAYIGFEIYICYISILGVLVAKRR